MPRRLLRFCAFCTYLDLTMAPQNPGKLFAARGKTLYLEPRRACQPSPPGVGCSGSEQGQPPKRGERPNRFAFRSPFLRRAFSNVTLGKVLHELGQLFYPSPLHEVVHGDADAPYGAVPFEPHKPMGLGFF